MSRSVETSNRGENFQAIVPGLCEPLAVTSSTAYSVAFEEETTLLEVFPTIDMWVQICLSTESPTVAAGSSGSTSFNKFLPGGIVNFIGVPKTRGVQYKIAAVRAGASNGVLYITQGRD